MLAVLGLFLFINIRRFILGRSVPHVDPSDLPPGAVLLDVRTDAERSRDQIKGSVHIPLHQLKARSGELARFRENTIVCYCSTGNRSVTAAVLLRKAGFSSANMKGGITNWKIQKLKK